MAANCPLEGRFDMTIDAKGRLFFPAKQREKLEGTTLHLTRGLDGCLFAYTEAQWDAFKQKIAELPISKNRMSMRYLMGNSFEASLDGQGRISVAPKLREFAQLKKDVTLVGLLDRMEIWDTDLWNEMNDSLTSDDIAAMLEELNF